MNALDSPSFFSKSLFVIFLAFVSPAYSQDREFSLEIKGLSENETDESHNNSIFQYLKEDILRKVPTRFFESWNPKKIILEFSEDCPSAGYFIDPIKSRKRWKICIKPEFYKSADLKSILAHEIFHVLHYSQSPQEEAWLREGLAQWFEFRVTGKLPSHAVEGALTTQAPSFGSPYPRLFEFDSKKSSKALQAQYGRDFLFVFYIWAQTQQSDELIWKFAEKQNSDSKGLLKIFEILKTQPIFLKFSKNPFNWPENEFLILRHFEIAKFHNHLQFSDQTTRKGWNQSIFFLFSTRNKALPLGIENSTEIKFLAQNIQNSGIVLSAQLFEGPPEKLIELGSHFSSENFDVLVLDREAPFSVITFSDFSKNPNQLTKPTLFLNRMK